jgi:hypothetical protein
VILPNGVYYYISKNGFEFFEDWKTWNALFLSTINGFIECKSNNITKNHASHFVFKIKKSEIVRIAHFLERKWNPINRCVQLFKLMFWVYSRDAIVNTSYEKKLTIQIF